MRAGQLRYPKTQWPAARPPLSDPPLLLKQNLCWLPGQETAVSRCTGSQISCWRWTELLLWMWRISVRVEFYDNDADKRPDEDQARSVSSPLFCLRAWSQRRRLVCFFVLLLLRGCICQCTI